jgi:hypothetical protein
MDLDNKTYATAFITDDGTSIDNVDLKIHGSYLPHNFDCETTIRRRSLMFLIRVKALASATPSEVDRNSIT